ncbi:exosome complex component RRP40 [Nematocida sp. LUAm3]|nr:exosome complex component RRP40 [Nematocida sp. LUAm3]KAI5173952.1 exosome complex component RRP40 [Nematocida sp. LUAm2]KAI5177303.1 exosome complex component RRP40 [Nematocida sp. LUAm1]
MFLLPGDIVPIKMRNTSIGIRKAHGAGKEEEFTCEAPGELLSFGNENYWINFHQNVYAPLLDDIVLGVIKGKGKDHYKVDVGAGSYAVIDFLDFPNATKRNKPNLAVDDIILAQVIEDAPIAEVRVSCKTNAVKNMGPLTGGTLINCGILKARGFFLSPPNLNFSSVESAVYGMNGYSWVSPPLTEAIREVLKKSYE